MSGQGPVNMPSGEQLLRIYNGALAHEALFSPPVLGPWRPLLKAERDELDRAIAPRVKLAGLAAARDATAAADLTVDDLQRYFYSVFSALAFFSAPDVRAAATLALATLYPDKLAVVNRAYADEVAAGPTFAKRLALPEVAAALATLERVVPGLAATGAKIVQAAAALGAALTAQDALLVEEAGTAASALFTARVRAHQQFALFAQVVTVVAYPDDSPEHKSAREALLGPYRRYLAASAGATSGVVPAATTAGAPLATAPAEA